MDESTLPHGRCECGCGQQTSLIKANLTKQGRVAGQFSRFVVGHNARKSKRKADYVDVRVDPDDPYYCMTRVTDFVPEHRLVMARHIGRPLTRTETVHHLNGVRDDNRIENLELWASAHPAGQRASDLVAWAREILERYEAT